MTDAVIPIEAVRTFRNLAVRHLGLGIDEKWEIHVAARIAKRLKDLKMPLHRYLVRLYQERDGGEILAFWNLLQSRRASFFEPWDDYMHLHAYIMRLLARGQRRFRLWSAGCGSGEEGYSMALTVSHAAQSSGQHLDVEILVSDVSAVEIERGRRGIFYRWQLQHVPSNLSQWCFRHFSGGITISDELRSPLVFRSLNFAQPPFELTGPFDVIFCRRAVAELVPNAQMASVEAARGLLSDGGLFVAGEGQQREPEPVAVAAAPPGDA